MEYAEKIRERREALGITEGVAEDCLGINSHWYRDLEHFDDELTMTLSIAQVSRLCVLLRTEPFELLGEEPPQRHVSAAELRALVLEDIRRRQWSLEEFGEHVGWDVQGLVDSPDAYIAEMNLDGLHDLCSHLGLRRIEAIPEPVAV